MARKNVSIKIILFGLGYLLIAAFFFYLVLVPRESSILKTLGVLGRYNLTRFIPGLVILLFISFFFKNPRISRIYAWAVILISCALALIGLWASAYSENYVIAGLVPRSDALYHYAGALKFWLQGSLTGFASRRPLFGSFLAFWLSIFGGNLQFVLAVLAFLGAVVAYAAFLQIRRILKPLASILFFVVIFLFLRRFIGLTMSEILGCLLGIAALTIWLYALGIREQNDRLGLIWFLVGIFVYMLAQMSRPADVVSLPLLVLFAGWLWRGKKKFSWSSAGFSSAALALGVFLNGLVYSLFGSRDKVMMNNFGYGVYGVAVGGKGWKQIFFDFPELYTMETGIRERTIAQIIISQITHHPGELIKGLFVQVKILFSFNETNSLFSFVSANNQLVNFALMGGLLALLAVGVIVAVRRRRRSEYLLLLFLLAGMFLSMSVSPAYQTQYMRVFAASIPILAFAVSVGLSGILDFLHHRFQLLERLKTHRDNSNNWAVLLPGLVLTGIVIFSSFFVRLESPMIQPAGGGCAPDQAEVVFQTLPGTGVTIFKNTPDRMTWVPFVSRFDYQRDIHSICCEDDIAYYSSIPGGTEIFPTVNLLNGEQLMLIAKSGTLPKTGELVHACGRIEDIYRSESTNGFFYPDSMQIIEP